MFTLTAIVGHANGLAVWEAALIVTPSLVGFVLSLRIRVKLYDDRVEFRGYVRRRTFYFRDVAGFDDVGYSGLWSNSNTQSDGWTGFGMRMIEVDTGRRDIELPATLCGPKTAVELVLHLNERVDEHQAYS
ncbi:hypothetical protein FHX48_001122 [Microbacterium halimionae]|uniref:PH domain-containing protein n=1 Tax=Microbacterium halimionae TaxID=1526413 RepID=A0A7W3JNI5_9MICO|nr:hypothetical protein [Microbacterium halimionae]MBA8816049.1 hypothetical protein [Microbacterium halimionae]NII96251.1 hypothetical protein [Microbacterium halimionae]